MAADKARRYTKSESSRGNWLRPLLWGSALLASIVIGKSLLTNDPPPKPIIAAPRYSENKDRLFLTDRDVRSVTLPNGERQAVASLLSIAGPMRYGQFHWNDKAVPPGQVWIRVDLSSQMMSVFKGQHEIGTGVILFGADSHPTPIGRFPILAKFKDHQSSIYDAKMPFTLRLTGDGVSIHGSNVRRGAATHGCIGIPTEFASHIFAAVKVSDPVFIIG
jgi:L,D-transpeptidase catalytic domain